MLWAKPVNMPGADNWEATHDGLSFPIRRKNGQTMGPKKNGRNEIHALCDTNALTITLAAQPVPEYCNERSALLQISAQFPLYAKEQRN